MKYTANYNLKKPEGTDVINIDDLNDNADIIDSELKKLNTNKVDKVSGKGLSTNDYTDAEKNKLAGIEAGANKYVHPSTHPASMITESTTRRFTSDVEKANWDSKETPEGAQAKANAAASSALAAANSYTDQEVGALAGEGNVKTVKQLDDDLAAHKEDYVHHAGYGTASGTNAKTITLNPAPSGYKEGMTIAFKNVTQNTGAVTINVNGRGAKPVLKSNGNTLSSGNLKAGSIYTVRYNGSNFILQGEGGEYGTAQAQDVLSGKTIGTEEGIITGTMPNRGAINNTITTQGGQIIVPEGYHNGEGIVKAQFANLVPENIKKGVNVGGVIGTLSSPRFIAEEGIFNYFTGEMRLRTSEQGSGRVETTDILYTAPIPGQILYSIVLEPSSVVSGYMALYVNDKYITSINALSGGDVVSKDGTISVTTGDVIQIRTTATPEYPTRQYLYYSASLKADILF